MVARPLSETTKKMARVRAKSDTSCIICSNQNPFLRARLVVLLPRAREHAVQSTIFTTQSGIDNEWKDLVRDFGIYLFDDYS